MKTRVLNRLAIPAVAACTLLVGHGAFATVYTGNGNSGFGGGIGSGSLTITDNNAGSVTFSLGAMGNSLNGNDFVLYLSTGGAGITNTSTLSDNGDGGREAISGTNNGNPSQSIATFPTGFTANYALSFEDGFVGLFALPPNMAATGANLTYITGANQSGEPDVITLALATLGLTQGQSFQLDGTLISTTAYRSDETIGPASFTNGEGFTEGLTFTGANTYVTTPEPASAGVLVVGGVLALRRRRCVNAR